MTKKKLFWLVFGVLAIVFAVIQFIPPEHPLDSAVLTPAQPGATRD